MLKNLKKMISKMMVIIMLVSVLGFNAMPVHAAMNVVVNPGVSYQTFDGFGLSTCWWGNIIGGWPDSDRQAFVNLAYGPPAQNCLGLNIARYNIGGGDNPNHSHMLTGANVPGYEPSSGVYDWTADPNQRWVLNYALQRNPNLIKVAFSNSPPYWMTNSGCSAGATDGSTNNLSSSNYGAFADYLTEVVKHFRDSWGITFDYLSPINEPDGNWGANGQQEGCHYDVSSQKGVIQAVKSSLNSKGLTTKTQAPETENIDDFVNYAGSYDSATKAALDSYCTHSYHGSNRSGAYSLAQSDNNKPLWLSEYSSFPGGHDATHTEINSSMILAGSITNDLRNLKPRAWNGWVLSEGEESCISHNFNANLIHTPYTNNPNHVYYITKQYYTLGQFSRFIRPGYVFIDSNDPNTVTAWDRVSGNLVIVVTNTNTSSVDYTYDLSLFKTYGTSASVYRTSASESGAQLSNINLSGSNLSVTAAAQSVTTYVIPGMSYASAGTTTIINDTATGTGNNQFDYQASGDWTYYADGRGYYGDNHCSIATNSYLNVRFNGNGIKFYGAKDTSHGIMAVSIDGGPETNIDEYASNRQDTALLYNSGTITQGQHTLKVRVTGTKNASSSNYAISADRVDVSSSPVVTINDHTTGTGNNQFDYQTSGNWTYYSDSRCYNGDNTCSDITNSYVNVRFYGNGIKWYGAKDTSHGIMAVSIDGGTETNIDTYSSSRQDGVLLFDSGTITQGQHTLKVRVTGTKNASSSDTCITADRVDVSSSPVTVTVNDHTTGTSNNQFDYQTSGNWTYYSDVRCYNGDNTCSDITNSYVNVRFYGSRIKWYGSVDTSHGIMAVSIDGGTETNIDTYSSSRQDSVMLFDSGTIAQGQHTLKVRVTGTKNAGSSDTCITADKVDITQ